jgi:hypothetical protein
LYPDGKRSANHNREPHEAKSGIHSCFRGGGPESGLGGAERREGGSTTIAIGAHRRKEKSKTPSPSRGLGVPFNT